MEFKLSEQKNPQIIADDVVVTLEYTLTVNGEVLDSSKDSGPIVFLQGYQNIVPGLEKALYGMKVGDKKSVKVTPAEGYGDVDPEAVMELPKSEFPEEIPLEVGVELDIQDEDGEIMTATIVSVNKNSVKLDFNHPLAGQELNFDVEIADLREATEEEIQHGHVHGEDFDEDDEYYEGDEDLFDLEDDNHKR